MKKVISMTMGLLFLSCGIFESKTSSSVKKLYVCLQAQNQVAVYNTPSLKLLKLVDIKFESDGNTPHFVVIDEINNFWFVTAMDGGYVAQFDLLSDEFIDTLAVGNIPALMTMDPVNKTLFCSRMNMVDMPGMGGMENMMTTNIITEINYTEAGMSLGEKFTLDSNSIHAITYDFNKENIMTASITDDWLYKISLYGLANVSNTLDPSITEIVGNDPNRLQPIQIIALDDNLIAISCSGYPEDVNGQVQIWNINADPMVKVASHEFRNRSLPWHLIKSPISDEIFIVLGGSSGEGGVACLAYSQEVITSKWEYYNVEFNALHGITVDENGEYIYVTSRGDHYLYQLHADTGALLDSTPLGAEGQPVMPGGLSVMQNTCTGCE